MGQTILKALHKLPYFLNVHIRLKMPWGKKSNSYTFKESRDKKSVQGLSYNKKLKQAAAKAAHISQNKSMAPDGQKQESFREFYKMYRPKDPPKTVNDK